MNAKTRNTEHETRNTEHGTWNTEHGTMNILNQLTSSLPWYPMYYT
jgi:hypothetical protein